MNKIYFYKFDSDYSNKSQENKPDFTRAKTDLIEFDKNR